LVIGRDVVVLGLLINQQGLCLSTKLFDKGKPCLCWFWCTWL